jgi:hypothetical protein
VIKQALTANAVMAVEAPDGPAPTWLTLVVTADNGGGKRFTTSKSVEMC